MSILDVARDALGTDSEDAPDSIGVPLDDAFELLANDRRRLTVRIVAEADRDGETVQLGRLAESIASFEQDVPVGELDHDQRKRVYVGLYQGHVPKLAGAGIVAVDRIDGPGEISATATTHDVDALLDVLEDVFTSTEDVPCPKCGTPMAALPRAGGTASPCGCTLDPAEVPAQPGVIWG